MSLGFKVWTDDAITWQWIDVGGYGAHGAVTVNQWSRLYPPSEVFDMTGFIVTEADVNGVSPDVIMSGGVAMYNGIPPGPLEQMYSMHMMVKDGDWGEVYTICIDSSFVPPSGAFVFQNEYGAGLTPTVLWPDGGRCWPASWPRCLPPEWSPDQPSQLVIDNYLGGGLTLSASGMSNDALIFDHLDIINGGGTVTLDNHNDGTCEVYYVPVLVDIGCEIIIPVTLSDGCFGYPCVPAHEIQVTVLDFSPLAIDCGWWYENGVTNNLIVKTDITAEPQSAGLVYSLISGPGQIDPSTGTFSWMPGPSDIGEFSVVVGVSDGANSEECTFTIDVIDENCCPGDVNFSSDVNVGDAVYLINYIFRSGDAPLIMNWADANADCNVDVGDVVFLINFVFNSGPGPELGCFN
jgi:hypothetical protein